LQDSERCPTDLRDFTWGYLHRLCRRELLTLPTQSAPILAVAISPDGRTLATAAGEERRATQAGIVSLWDTTTGRQRASLHGITGVVFGLAFSPDGHRLATVGEGVGKSSGEIKVWDLDTLTAQVTLRGHEAPITCVCFHPDG